VTERELWLGLGVRVRVGVGVGWQAVCVSVMQLLFRELDEKLAEVKSLLTRAESILSHGTTNTDLKDVVDRLQIAALDTRDAASKLQVCLLSVIVIIVSAAAAATGVHHLTHSHVLCYGL